MQDRDVQFLRAMLYDAACWRPGQTRDGLDAVLSIPEIAVYVSGWGREGDAAMIADDERGVSVGAAWYRLFTQESHGYGFVSESVPEIGIAVSASVRRRGVGTVLLTALIGHARQVGYSAVSLSVEEDNPALHLYDSFGFVSVGRVGNARTMLLDLS